MQAGPRDKCGRPTYYRWDAFNVLAAGPRNNDGKPAYYSWDEMFPLVFIIVVLIVSASPPLQELIRTVRSNLQQHTNMLDHKKTQQASN